MDVENTPIFDPRLALGDEKSLLKKNLHGVQQALLWKVEGLSDEDLRRPMTLTQTNLIGIVKHLTGVTGGYLCVSFGRPRPDALRSEGDEELWHGIGMWATPEESCQEIIEMYRRACEAGMRTIEELDLETHGRHWTGVPMSLRTLSLIVLMDTTRHTGHADVVREMIDGRVGGSPGDDRTSLWQDEEYVRMVRGRRSGDIDRETWLAYSRSRTGQR